MASQNHSSKPLSLQELCMRQLVSHVLHSKDAGPQFSTLEPRVQWLLIDRIQNEHAQTRKGHENWSRLAELVPYIDTQHYLNPLYGTPQSYEPEDPYIRNWGFFVGDDSPGTCYYNDVDDGDEDEYEEDYHDDGNPVHWNIKQLHSSAMDSDFEVCYHQRWVTCPSCQSGKRRFLWERVSPQLLLYRLVILFGMPPEQNSKIGGNTSWIVELLHLDNSVLRLEETAYGCFSGTAQASADALKLLKYLTGTQFEHPHEIDIVRHLKVQW